MGKRLGLAQAAVLLAVTSFLAPASAQEAADGERTRARSEFRTAWDLYPLGRHAAELPHLEFVDYACGSDGGPPSLVLMAFWEYGKCPLDPKTGLHEVYFRYDDEQEYLALVFYLPREQYGGTQVFGHPMIVSALFDRDGFHVGMRFVTDPRVAVDTRLRSVTMLTFFLGRYSASPFQCEDLPPAEGETPAGARFIKNRCIAEANDRRIVAESHFYRRPGEHAFDPRAGGLVRTEGQFWSETRFQEVYTGAIQDREAKIARYAEWAAPVPEVALRARDCPGCDFAGRNLKRLDLRGADLAGANLTDANLHGALLVGANLAGADLTRANMNKADAKRANLDGAVLREVYAYEAHFDGVSARGADFSGARMARAQLLSADFGDANLSAVDLYEARLGRARFVGANLAGSSLYAARAQGADLTGASLVSSVLYATNLAQANLSQADLRNADLRQSDLRRARFNAADLRGARLNGTKLQGAVFTGALTEGAAFPAGFDPQVD